MVRADAPTTLSRGDLETVGIFLFGARCQSALAARSIADGYSRSDCTAFGGADGRLSVRLGTIANAHVRDGFSSIAKDHDRWPNSFRSRAPGSRNIDMVVTGTERR